MRPDACGICLLKQTASGAQSVTSPSKIEGFREFEADLSALFLERRVRENDEKETEKSPCTGDGSSYAGRCTIARNGCRSSTGGRSSDSGNTTGNRNVGS